MPDRRLGPKQLATLRDLTLRYVGLVPYATERSLIRRGLLRAADDGPYCVSAAGLRALADAIDAGQVEDGLAWFARQRAEKAARGA
jgi:hypothetical protein